MKQQLIRTALSALGACSVALCQALSFELSFPGSLPNPGPDPEGWTRGAGTITVVPFGPVGGPSSGFPSDNAQWVIVNSIGAAGNLPVNNPGVWPSLPLPPGSAARLRHAIAVPASGGPFSITFRWTYVSTECAFSPFNDFFAVDFTDAGGARVANLLYIDTFSPVMVSTSMPSPNESGSVLAPACMQAREAQPVGVPKTTTALLPAALNGQTLYFEANVGNVLDVSFDGHAWIDDIRLTGGTPGALGLNLSQPLGSGSVRLVDTGLVQGAETFNAISLEPAPGGIGSGPYLGLWTSDVNLLLAQVLTPVGTLPFHLLPNSPTFTFGPITGIPIGLTLEAVVFEWNGMTVGRTSAVAALTIQ